MDDEDDFGAMMDAFGDSAKVLAADAPKEEKS